MIWSTNQNLNNAVVNILINKFELNLLTHEPSGRSDQTMRSKTRSLELMDSTPDDLRSDRIMVIHHPFHSTAFLYGTPKIVNMRNSVTKYREMINTLDSHLVFLDFHEFNNILFLLLLSYLYPLTNLEYSKRFTYTHTLDDKGPDKKQWKSFVHLLKEVFAVFHSISNAPILLCGENLAF